MQRASFFGMDAEGRCGVPGLIKVVPMKVQMTGPLTSDTSLFGAKRWPFQ